MAAAKDAHGSLMVVGSACTFRPDLDGMEATFGTVPDDYEGDPCTVRGLPSPTVALVKFEDDESIYRVHTGALLVTDATKPARPVSKKKEQPDEDEKQD